MNEFGIDTAFGNVITPAMAQQLDFAIIRIGTLGYGKTGTSDYYNKTLSVDSGFYTSVTNLINAGKKWGCYIFSYAFDARSAQHEADEVLRVLSELGLSPTLPIFFDWEYDSYDRVIAAGVSLTPLLMLNLNHYFMAQIKNKSNYRVGWYANADFQNNYFYSQYGISGAEAAKNFMEQGFYYWRAWISSTPPTNPDGDLWQYRLDTNWNGIDADLNRVVSDRFWNGGGGGLGKIPVWLMLYLMQKNKKERSITIIT